MNTRTALLLLSTVLLLAACGVKGPLVLPPAEATVEEAPETAAGTIDDEAVEDENFEDEGAAADGDEEQGPG